MIPNYIGEAIKKIPADVNYRWNTISWHHRVTVHMKETV